MDTVRAARPADDDAVRAVVIAAFDAEEEGEGVRVADVVRALDAAAATRASLVAVVGHVQLTRAWVDARESWMRGRLVYPEVLWSHDAVGLRDPSLAEVEQFPAEG